MHVCSLNTFKTYVMQCSICLSILVKQGLHPAYVHPHRPRGKKVGYLIVFSIVTKRGQTIEFLLWGTIVPLNFLVGYHCSIVASTKYPTTYGVRVHSDAQYLNILYSAASNGDLFFHQILNSEWGGGRVARLEFETLY